MPSIFTIVVAIIFLIGSLYNLIRKSNKGWGGEHPELDKLFTYGLIIVTSFVISSALFQFIFNTIID